MPQYVFICDANAEVGFGHFSRCFNIASGIRSVQPEADVLFQGDLNRPAMERLSSLGCRVVSPAWPLDDLTVILDRYDVDQAALGRLATRARALIKIDDFNELDLRNVAAVVNFRVGAETWDYAARHRFLGLAYYPAHPDFEAIRRRRLEASDDRTRQQGFHVVVSIGGTDRYGVAVPIIEALDRVLSGATITWLGADNPPSGKADLLRNQLVSGSFSPDVARHYAVADAVICGGGVTKYEAGFCMIPNACLSQTAEQHRDTEVLAQTGLTFDLGRGTADSATDELDGLLSAFFSREQRERQLTHLATRYNTGSLRRLALAIVEL